MYLVSEHESIMGPVSTLYTNYGYLGSKASCGKAGLIQTCPRSQGGHVPLLRKPGGFSVLCKADKK